jgi:hypothetical protein
MADLGIPHAHVNQYRPAQTARPATRRSKIQLIVHATLVTAAFVFVAALVFGILG